MKSLVRKLIHSVVSGTASSRRFYDLFWLRASRLCDVAQRTAAGLASESDLSFESERSAVLADVSAFSQTLRQNLVVQQGPFAGLSYATAESFGSTFYPKVLGTYECELHEAIESIVAARPRQVLDIGCAEGYYAVGIAKRLDQAEVTAADIDLEARELCQRNANVNGVADRVRIIGGVTRDALLRLEGSSAAVICDCEGFERQLFDAHVARVLHRCHLIIECHDFIVPGITRQLHSIFKPTHDVHIIRSVPDVLRPQVFKSESIRHFNHDTQLELMRELRPTIMTWLWCRPAGSAVAVNGDQGVRDVLSTSSKNGISIT